MNDIRFRLLINTLALFFVSAQFARFVLEMKERPSQDWIVASMFALLVVNVFGCVLSAIDYAKSKE